MDKIQRHEEDALRKITRWFYSGIKINQTSDATALVNKIKMFLKEYEVREMSRILTSLAGVFAMVFWVC